MTNGNVYFEIVNLDYLKHSHSSDIETMNHYINFIEGDYRIFKFNVFLDTVYESIFVVEFAPTSDIEHWTYLTIGAGRNAMEYPQDWEYERPERRMELLMYSKQRNDEVATLLSGLAIYPFRNKTIFAPGHTVSSPINDSVLRGFTFTSILFTAPYLEPREFRTINHGNGRRIHILWTIMIYPSEKAFVHQHNDRELLKLFRENDIDVLDFNRPLAT